MEQTSDDALMEGVAGGSRRDLAQLYQRHSPRLFALGRRILGRQGGAEDALQDVFIEVWQKAGDYLPARGSALSWLLLRMRSRCLDRLRRSQVLREEPGPEAELEHAPSPGDDPGEVHDRQRVRKALVLLPADQRVALQLAYFSGLTGAEIAARLGAPLGTIKSRLTRGLSQLRAVIGAEGR